MPAFKRGADRRYAKYQAICPDGGSGTFSVYGVFDGISLSTSDVHAPRVVGIRGLKASPDVIAILHSRLGSIRVMNGDETFCEVAEGEAALVRIDEAWLSFEYPDGYYHGTFLRLSLRSLTLSSRHGMSEFGIDLKALVASIRPGQSRALDDSIDMSHTFSEVYNLLAVSSPSLGYLRLKAFELLVLLGVTGPRGGLEDVAGSSLFVGNVQVAYRAQQVMTRRISNPIGIEALVRQCEVSPTVLKESFRKTFGMPVGTWYRAYRINRACDLLCSSDLPVADVARAVGYASASKFSRAFADATSMTPSAWRRAKATGEGEEASACCLDDDLDPEPDAADAAKVPDGRAEDRAGNTDDHTDQSKEG